MSRIVVFSHQIGFGKQNIYTEEFEFEDDATDEEITEAFKEWVWEQVGDDFTWYDKE